MKINGLVVCVNYSDYLSIGISRWYNYLHTLTVVTDMQDDETLDLVDRYPGVRIHRTDAFYRDGAVFNKGRAMEEARKEMPWGNWILFFDADVVPETDWYLGMSRATLAECNLYGADRYQAIGMQPIDDDAFQHLKRIPDAPCDGGYFHMFHSSIKDQSEMFLESNWPHAGVYDTHFMRRWLPRNRRTLPIRLSHIGPMMNWCGRGNTEGMNKLLAERRRLGGYFHERMEVK